MKRIAVITGGNRGIGRAIATKLATDGFVVAIHYGSNEDAAERTVNEIKTHGGEVFSFTTKFCQQNGDPGPKFWSEYDTATINGLRRTARTQQSTR